MTDKNDDEIKMFIEWYEKKHPEIKKKEKPHRSRFDYMTPEQYEFWKDEHQ